MANEKSEEKLTLGDEMTITKSIKAQAPSAQAMAWAKNIPGWRQPPSAAMQQPRSFEYVVEMNGTPLQLTGKALSQLYVVFGAPGVGKSHFLKYLLRQLAAPTGWTEPWGGLLLDPKQTLIGEVEKEVPSDRLHVIGPAAGSRMNILASRLEPSDLGTALALAAQSAGISAQDGYWMNEMKRLFGDGLALLQMVGRPMTLNELARLFLCFIKGTKRTRLEAGCAALEDQQLDADGERRREAILSSLSGYSEAKGNNQETVRSFVRQILAPFLDPALDFLSDEKGRDSIADLIIRDGKWVLLDIPKSKLAVSRFLATLTKVLFVSGALNRRTFYPDNHRRIFLFADEYAEIASDLPGEGFGDSYFFSQARQFGVLSFIATQGVPMLENSGVRETWKCILTNSAGKLMFRVGDADSAELASKLMGESDVIMTDRNISHSGVEANVGMGQRLDRWTQVSSDLFITGLKQKQFVFMGLVDGTGTSSIRYAKVPENPPAGSEEATHAGA